MKIELQNIKVSDLVDGYADNQEGGVVGYHGQLNIRPKYQREFIYSPEQEAAVIRTVMKGFPLNSMYWVELSDGRYEVMDGQQRTLSICQYINGDFSVKFGDNNPKNFRNLTKEEQQKILDYCLTVYFCTGTDKEKLEWFQTVNIAGMKLTDQELRNAIYAGPWVTDAKRYFSKTGCAAVGLGGDYISGSTLRQEILEKVLKWISAPQGKTVEQYMADHQYDNTAKAEWDYFEGIISWIEANFVKRDIMKGVDWGRLYNEHKDDVLNKDELEKRISELEDDDEVQKRTGIYEYVLTGRENCLGLRAFGKDAKKRKYKEQQGICPICGKHFELKDMEGDHIIPWSKGGKTEYSNLQMLCLRCNREKSNH